MSALPKHRNSNLGATLAEPLNMGMRVCSIKRNGSSMGKICLSTLAGLRKLLLHTLASLHTRRQLATRGCSSTAITIGINAESLARRLWATLSATLPGRLAPATWQLAQERFKLYCKVYESSTCRVH
ncbi:hypothetical protein HGRIS_011341 [Hohenbuehelia grisea]|uniref:Uncharacterized protein n=1 Tax=Hohenbuehelia grisea TaxID=104357 RepID=A0ABR3JUU4_9AGAR